jgi:hypothetical protein
LRSFFTTGEAGCSWPSLRYYIDCRLNESERIPQMEQNLA